jgi:hypothetical protein
MHPFIDLDPRLDRLLTKVGTDGHLDFFLLAREFDLGHKTWTFLEQSGKANHLLSTEEVAEIVRITSNEVHAITAAGQ